MMVQMQLNSLLYFLPCNGNKVSSIQCCNMSSIYTVNGFVVFRGTVVLRRWESETKIWFYQTS